MFDMFNVFDRIRYTLFFIEFLSNIILLKIL